MLDIDDLHKTYGTTRALDGVSLQVAPGEMVGFVGANGAGKSTTMRIAMGLVAADTGAVRWNGSPLSFATRQRFGYMPEERGLYPKMGIVEQVAYFGRLHGMSSAAAHARAGELVEQMAVVAKPRDFVQALSLGNQQRVQLAAALVHDPELLILDEPFSGLDPVGVDTMADVLAQRRAAGCGVLFSSHQLELVERLCDRVAIVRNGRVVAYGTLDELRGNAGHDALEVTVDADPSWVDRVPGATVVAREGARVTLSLADPADDQAVLAAAAGAGRVERFAWRQPSLAELYRETIGADEVVA
jgi:ABC-2 type transport system ATP-binding protein